MYDRAMVVSGVHLLWPGKPLRDIASGRTTPHFGRLHLRQRRDDLMIGHSILHVIPRLVPIEQV